MKTDNKMKSIKNHILENLWYVIRKIGDSDIRTDIPTHVTMYPIMKATAITLLGVYSFDDPYVQEIVDKLWEYVKYTTEERIPNATFEIHMKHGNYTIEVIDEDKVIYVGVGVNHREVYTRG